MAEFLLKKMLFDEKLSGVEVFSRGVTAIENSLMSEIGQALLLSEDGIHAENHRSKKLQKKIFRKLTLFGDGILSCRFTEREVSIFYG